jgi:hypothetical protein
MQKFRYELLLGILSSSCSERFMKSSRSISGASTSSLNTSLQSQCFVITSSLWIASSSVDSMVSSVIVGVSWWKKIEIKI